MKRSNVLLLYVVGFVVGTAIFIDLFHTGLFGWWDVFFYRGIALLGVATLTVGATLFVVRKFYPKAITLKDVYITLLTFVSVNLLFFTHVPVTGERSISVFLLRYMNSNSVVTKEELTNALLTSYIGADKQIEKRIHEQLVTGDIVPQGNGYKLTTQGKWLMKMYAFIETVFGLQP